MKKLILIAIACMFSVATMAQETKTADAENPADNHPAGHSCYMLKDNALMHCMGTKAEAQEADVKLENGMVITRVGKVLAADGKTVELKNGQCIDMLGMIGDCAAMHKDMMKESDTEKPDNM